MQRLHTAAIDWSSGSPRDPVSGDAWCDAADPRGEARHVFVEGNGLPGRFGAMRPGDAMTVAEIGLGFGRTLCEFVAAFLASAPPATTLRIVSLERSPLPPAEARRGLAWCGADPAIAAELLEQWPEPLAGIEPIRLAGGRVRGLLVLGEAGLTLPRLRIPGGVDAWCLDGFAPARDESAWAEPVLAAVGRLTAAGGTLATWTAAARVRSRLAAAGFELQRRPGHGRKRDMTVGRLAGGGATSPGEPAGRATVIGGGLAGSAVAAALAERGVAVRVLDASPHPPGGASANPRAIAEPVLEAADSPIRRLRWTGWRSLQAEFRPGSGDLPVGVGCGLLHGDLPRWRRIAEGLGEAHPVAWWVDAAEASDRAGVRLDRGGLLVPSAGWLVPADLVARRMQRVVAAGGTVEAGATAAEVAAAFATASPRTPVIDATGGGHAALAVEWPAEPVRGQVSLLPPTSATAGLRIVACGRSALLPVHGGHHLLASTYDHHDADEQVREADHERVLRGLAEGRPALARALSGVAPTGAWVGVRRTTPDRRPLIGPVPGRPGVLVSLAHGSRGLVGGAFGGAVLAAMCVGDPWPAFVDDLAAVDPARHAGGAGASGD